MYYNNTCEIALSSGQTQSAKTDFSMTATAFQTLVHTSASQTNNFLILVCLQFQKRHVRC